MPFLCLATRPKANMYVRDEPGLSSVDGTKTRNDGEADAGRRRRHTTGYACPTPIVGRRASQTQTHIPPSGRWGLRRLIQK